MVGPTPVGIGSSTSSSGPRMRSSGSGGGGGGDDPDDDYDSNSRNNDYNRYPPRRTPGYPGGGSGGGDPPGRGFPFPGGDPPPGDHFNHGSDPWGYSGFPPPGFPGGDGDPPGPSGPQGPGGDPRGVIYIPYPYVRPNSPPLLKLPNITKEAYFWDGDTSKLKSKIRLWDREFSKHSPNLVVPWIRSLVPDDHQWRLDKAQDFQDCVDALLVFS